MNARALKGGLVAASLAVFTLFALPTAAAAAETVALAAQPSHKVVFQVSDADPAKWNLALNNARNAMKALGKNNLVAEIVAFGPGVNMLRFDSEVADRVAETLASGVRIVACQNTMAAMKLTEKDMLPNIGYVPAGVVELIEKQQQGYAYIRP